MIHALTRWWHRVRRYYGFEAAYHPLCCCRCQEADAVGMSPYYSCAGRCMYLDHPDYV